jgi:hypothetical protein
MGVEVPSAMVDVFRKRHKSYFITNEITPVKGLLCKIFINLTVYTNGTDELKKEIEAIFNKYKDKLNSIKTDGSKFEIIIEGDSVQVGVTDSLINDKAIRAEITKLPTVAYIENMTYTKFQIEQGILDIDPKEIAQKIEQTTDKIIPVSIFKPITNEIIPLYYEFNIITIYKYSYEIISG